MVQYWSKAAEMGDMDAHHYLARRYLRGAGVEQDIKKFIHHSVELLSGNAAGRRGQ